MFSLICAWTNSWATSWDVGDLRRHCAHYDVIVMILLVSYSIRMKGKGTVEADEIIDCFLYLKDFSHEIQQKSLFWKCSHWVWVIMIWYLLTGNLHMKLHYDNVHGMLVLLAQYTILAWRHRVREMKFFQNPMQNICISLQRSCNVSNARLWWFLCYRPTSQWCHMSVIASQSTGVLTVQHFVQANINENIKAPHHWFFV